MINIEQIAFVEHRQDRIELVFTTLSGGAQPIIALRGAEATALLHVGELLIRSTHHKVRVRLKFEIGSSTARQYWILHSAAIIDAAGAILRGRRSALQKVATKRRRGITSQHNSAFLVRCFTQAEALPS